MKLRMNSRTETRGFTLFELLTTMSVIVLMAGILYASIDLKSSSSSLDRGLEAVHSMVRVARSQAIVNGVSCRMIINFDNTDKDNFLRQIGIVIKDDSAMGMWKAVDRGVMLPEGVYVVPRSKATFAGSWPVNPDRKSVYKKESTDSVQGGAVFKYEYPLVASVPENAGVDWMAVQFAPNGRLEVIEYDGGGLPSLSNQIVVGRAQWVGSALTFTDFEDLKGVRFKLNGASFSVKDASKLGYDPAPEEVESGGEDEGDGAG